MNARSKDTIIRGRVSGPLRGALRLAVYHSTMKCSSPFIWTVPASGVIVIEPAGGMWNVEDGRVRLGVQVHVILRRVAARAMVGEVAERAVRVDYTPVRGPALELPGKPLIH